MISVLHARLVGGASLLAVLFMGCGGGGTKGVSVEGKLMTGPTALTVPAGQTVHLSFVGTSPKGDAANFPADINPADGSFTVNKAGGGVPPGKYRLKMTVSLAGTDPASLAKQAELSKRFAVLDGKECEVTADGNQKFTIDTSTGAITKVN